MYYISLPMLYDKLCVLCEWPVIYNSLSWFLECVNDLHDVIDDVLNNRSSVIMFNYYTDN